MPNNSNNRPTQKQASGPEEVLLLREALLCVEGWWGGAGYIPGAHAPQST